MSSFFDFSSDKRYLKESGKKLRISVESPPSVCLYTVLNSPGGLTSADFSEDSGALALGYGNSTVQVLPEFKKLY